MIAARSGEAVRRGTLLGFDCPARARSRSLKSAHGVATRSAAPTLGFGVYEKDGRGN
jgi:hypothetical protein